MTAAPQTTLSENKGEKILLDGHKHCPYVLYISVFPHLGTLELYLHDWKLLPEAVLRRLQRNLTLNEDYIVVFTNFNAQLLRICPMKKLQ